jgi:predicted ABC-class ATPase
MEMLSRQDLERTLARIDGKGYKAYKDLQGEYDFGEFVLHVDNVQSDPFAPPSRLRITLDQQKAGFPAEMRENRVRTVALEDFLTRGFARACQQVGGKVGGTGKSGMVGIDRCGQEILERTSMRVTPEAVQARFVVGLPARGRSVQGRKAASILCGELPEIVRASLLYENLDGQALWRHICACEDQDVLRRALRERNLVAFVGNGAVLPRESGISDRPLQGGNVISFQSPPELEVGFELPHAGEIRGMGISEGVTLIVGGGYHGKSTLLKALERGVYNHVPGDGRDLVVTDDSAVKIRAEDGRSVSGVDIHPFISDLPFGADTTRFSSDNASGSTSQAANIVEALEADATLLLLDEDTSATNFMIRDGRMQHLVAKENEPITPFIDRVQDMYRNLGVSTVLVLGGSGDYFDVTDTVIMLKEYLPYEVTDEAKRVASLYATKRSKEIKDPLRGVSPRVPRGGGFRLEQRDKVKARGLHGLQYGRTGVDLDFLEQLVDESQTRAIAEMFRLLGRRFADGRSSLSEIVDRILQEVAERGLDALSPFEGKHPGDLAMPRKQEICAAINRFRKLRVR